MLYSYIHPNVQRRNKANSIQIIPENRKEGVASLVFPLSALLFDIVLEILASAIMQEKKKTSILEKMKYKLFYLQAMLPSM